MSKPPRPDAIFIWRLALAILILPAAVRAQNVTLQLKSGDRISGTILSENTNLVVLSNSWAAVLSIWRTNIAQTQIVATNHPGPAAGPPVSTNLLATIKAALKWPPPPPLLVGKRWSGQLQVGLDLIYAATKQENYHARLKLDYQRPYAWNKKKFFRNNFDYSVEYGRTDGTKSTDRMNASDKTAMDFDPKWYAYNLASVGYDQVQRINLEYEEGPGLGCHLFTRPRFMMNAESGLDYQEQDRRGSPNSSAFFYRVAENLQWKINPPATFTEKLELFPRDDFGELRTRFESTFSYAFWVHLALNFTVLDLYDTTPALRARANELQVHSSLSFNF